MSYTAELIAVGTELLLGNISNTDAQMISQGLSAIGINVYYHTVVGDNPARLRSAWSLSSFSFCSRSSKLSSSSWMRFLASSMMYSGSPSFLEMAKALDLPGMPISSL